MPFVWRNLIQLSRHLAEMNADDMIADDETYYRAAVGRAYYGCHKSVHEWLGNAGYSWNRGTRGSVHKDVLAQITTYMEQPEAGRIKRALQDLRLQREEADYDLTYTTPWNGVRALAKIEMAEYVIEQLDRARVV